MIDAKKLSGLKEGDEIKIQPGKAPQFRDATFGKEQGDDVVFKANGNIQVVKKSIFLKYCEIPGNTDADTDTDTGAKGGNSAPAKGKKPNDSAKTSANTDTDTDTDTDIDTPKVPKKRGPKPKNKAE